MARRSIFTVSYAPETYKHLDWIERKYHRSVATTIKEQLSRTPTTVPETANRLNHRRRLAPHGNYASDRTIRSVFSTT
jgi:hypothetical protein